MLQQHVIALQGVELLQEAPGHRVFVCVDDGDGAIVAHQPGQGLGLGRFQQQVVAVHVDAVGGDALAGVGAVRIGARYDDDVDAVEHGLQQPLGQLARHDQQGLAARGLVAVLLTDE